MTIDWKQKAWCDVRKNGRKTGEKKCWKWEGTRKDRRSFRIVYIPHRGYVATSFNGAEVGVGKSLSEAQMHCEKAPGVCMTGVKQQVRAPIVVAG